MVDHQTILTEAIKRAGANVSAKYNAASAEAQQDTNPVTWALDAVNSAGLGIAKAGIETKEFFGGQPNYEDRWPIQRAIEADAAELDRRSGVNAFVGDTFQFITGMVGVGKLTGGLKVVQALGAAGKAGRVGLEVAKGAVVGATAFDPQEERLSNLLESYPSLSNPVSAYLAAQPTDSDAEGRFKAALEGIGMDLALSGVFAASVKLFRAMKGGDEVAITAARSELEAAQGGHMGDDQGTTAAEGLTPAQANATTNQGSFEEAYGALSEPSPEPGSVQSGQLDGQANPTPPTTAPQATDLSQPLDGASPAPARGEGSSAMAATDGLEGTIVKDAEGNTIGSYVQEEGQPLRMTIDGAGELPTAKAVELEVPLETQVSDLLKGFDADMDAITANGSREAAELAGHRFGVSGNLPWQKLTDGGEQGLRVFTDQVASVFKTELDNAKGGDVLSDARLERHIAQRAALYGDDPTAVMGMLQQAGTNANSMAANMEAGYLIANKAMMDVFRLSTNIRMGNLTDFGGSAAMADKALKERLAMAVEALAQSRAMTAAAGRSLRRMRGQFRLTPEQLASLKTMDTEQLVEVLHASKGNPKALAQMANPGFLDRMVRGAGSIMANNLLWGWPTHAVNIATAAYMGMVRPAEKIIGSYLVKNGGGMRRAGLKEYGYMASSIADAWTLAKDAWVRGDSILSPHNTEWFTAGAAGGAPQSMKGMAAMGLKPIHTYRDFLENGITALNLALGMPTRTLGMMDEFIKQTSYRGYVQANAAVRAEDLGLTGKDLAAYVQKALDDAFDANYQALDKEALYEAQVRTFSQPLVQKGNAGWTTLGHALQTNVTQMPFLRAVFPFVKTPINVFRYTMKNTPILNGLQKEYRDMFQGKMGPEQQAHAYGQAFMGSLALASFSMATMNGQVTGGGPQEPGLRKALEGTGWKAYSMVFDNGDGTNTYVPYNRFDPVGMLAGMATDITEMLVTYPDREGDADDLATAVLLSILNNLKDKTYLQSISAALDAINDPDRSAAKWVGQVGEGLIPFSSALRNYANPDPYMREARSLVDHMLDRMPGFSQNLPPQRDPFGYPVKVRTGLVFQDNADDIVDAEQIRMFQETGAGLAVPVSYQMDGIDLRDLAVEGPNGNTTAYDRYLEIAIQPQGADKPMKDAVADVIRSETYQMAPDGVGSEKGTKLYMVQQVIQKYRAAAKKQLLREYPEEVGEPTSARAKEVREAYRQNRSGGMSPATGSKVQELLAGYGIK